MSYLPADIALVLWNAIPTPLDMDNAHLLVLTTVRGLETIRFGSKAFVLEMRRECSSNNRIFHLEL